MTESHVGEPSQSAAQSAAGTNGNIVSLCGGNFYVAYISNIINVFEGIFNLIEKILFLILGLKALNQKTISVPIVDGLIKKYMD